MAALSQLFGFHQSRPGVRAVFLLFFAFFVGVVEVGSVLIISVFSSCFQVSRVADLFLSCIGVVFLKLSKVAIKSKIFTFAFF